MFQFVVIALFASMVYGATIPTGLVPLLDGRIVGGQDTTIEEFPHQISMRYFGAHRCGGSIISESTIISAAHCVDGTLEQYMIIRAGTTNQRNQGVSRRVSRTIMHERYSRNTFDYDISIILLAEGLEFTPSIQPITLPESSDISNAGIVAFVSGWGTLREQGLSPDILQYVEVSVFGHDECSEAYRSGLSITGNMLCAGNKNGGRDACQGDSGGPLITYENGSSKLIGVVSWGYGCAHPSYPGVYARVSALSDWINEKLNLLRVN